MKFQGLYTAIVTPFVGNRVDEEAFRMLVEAQVAAGVAGIVAVGTTGESPTLTVKEHLRVIELAVESAAGRIQVVAGTGANSTAEGIHMTQEAEKIQQAFPGWRLCPFQGHCGPPPPADHAVQHPGPLRY